MALNLEKFDPDDEDDRKKWDYSIIGKMFDFVKFCISSCQNYF